MDNDFSVFSGVVLLFLLSWAIVKIFSRYEVSDNSLTSTPLAAADSHQYSTYLIYRGWELDFPTQKLDSILTNRFPYYNTLPDTDKEKFLKRMRKFLSRKTFVIHDKSGFVEMPVLICATAIQISFGLKRYLLPHYEYIQIYPREFLRITDSIVFLQGNVSGNSINISWKHFLHGFEFPNDGQHVGLHEMAHAYYFQNFETNHRADNAFIRCFPHFHEHGNKVFEEEKKEGKDLFTDYAMKNFHEFWAESVEVFFEKPLLLRAQYPQLYAALQQVLNQDPAALT